MIIDLAVDATPHLAAFKKAGVTDVIGYLNPHGATGKVITPARAKAIAQAGMSLAIVSEGWGDFAHGDISAAAGKRDAEHALAAMPLLGAPDGACVYFAVDTDASTNQIIHLVMPYFQAIRATFGGQEAPNGMRTARKYRVGVYASGAVCNAALAADFADLAWLAAPTGWLGSREFAATKKWVLHQGLPTHVAGVDCDPNTANGDDWGQFVPFGESLVHAPMPSAQVPSVVKPAPAPNPVLSLYDRQLDASSTAIGAILANGIHKIAGDLAAIGLVIPSGATLPMSNMLGKAALDAILSIKDE